MSAVDTLIDMCGKSSKTLRGELVFCMLRDLDKEDTIPEPILKFAETGKYDLNILLNYIKRIYKPKLIKEYVEVCILNGKYVFKDTTNWMRIPLISKRINGDVEVFEESIELYHWLKRNVIGDVDLSYTNMDKDYKVCSERFIGADRHQDLFIYFSLMRKLNYRLKFPKFFKRALKHDNEITKQKEDLLEQRFDWSLIAPFVKKEIYNLSGRITLKCKVDWKNIPFEIKWTDADYKLVYNSRKIRDWCNEHVYADNGCLPVL